MSPVLEFNPFDKLQVLPLIAAERSVQKILTFEEDTVAELDFVYDLTEEEIEEKRKIVHEEKRLKRERKAAKMASKKGRQQDISTSNNKMGG